ncbi:MAG: transporter [Burkholderiales bacterium]|nr:MAG: transporter [Burkholderiales bacterium]
MKVDQGLRSRSALALLLSIAAGSAGAQDMEPRPYTNVPVGTNFFLVGYAHSTGGLSTNPASAIQNARLTVRSPVIAYARAFSAWGQSAKFDVVLPMGSLSGSALVNGVPVTREISGLVDPSLRVSLNLAGAPALSLSEFASYRQDLITGVSVQVTAPLGQYDPNRLVNLGSNRWMLRPEIGFSKAVGRIRLEAGLSVSLFTTNHDYYGGDTLEQNPLYSGRANLVYQFDSGIWMALNGTYYAGGRTRLNGALRDDLIQASRVGATLSLPIDRKNSVKFSLSDGVTVRTGNTEFRILGVTWQHRWGAGP